MIDAPGINLDLSTLDDSAMLYRGALDPDVCEQIIDSSRGLETELTMDGGSCLLQPAPVDDLERLHGAHETMYAIFRATIAALGWDIEHAEVSRFGVTKYAAGQCMDLHVDDHERGPQAEWSVPHRGVAISVPLSPPGSWTGGQLRLRTRHGGWYKPELGQGDAIAFGTSTPHAVEPIETGERWVLLGWCYVNHDFWNCR